MEMEEWDAFTIDTITSIMNGLELTIDDNLSSALTASMNEGGAYGSREGEEMR